jgi:phage baseplate assembly protein W
MLMDVRGPAYPFRIDPATGQVALSEGTDKITENVRIILATRRGERPMNRDFGAGIHELVHEPNDGSLGRLIAKNARETLMQHEPRIVVLDTKISQKRGELVLELRYMHSDRPQADVMVIRLG